MLLVVAACTGEPARPDAAAPAPALGMNDVTMLVPLPVDLAAPTLLRLDFDRDTLVERSTFVSFVIAGDMAPKSNEQLVMGDYHLVAVRFDLCDRTAAPCGRDDDGRLRLVLQPLFRRDGATLAHDIGVHLFYRIPNAELPAVVDELRALAALAETPRSSPLVPSPALVAGDAAYRDRLRALVERYAVRAELVKLTTLGQERGSGAFAWVARGLERHGDALVAFPIPEMGLLNFTQKIQAGTGNLFFDVSPLAPTPIEPALNGLTWPARSAETKRAALDALEAIENPRLRSAADAQCMGCHVATLVGSYRAREEGVDRTTLPSHFTSAHDTSVSGPILTDSRIVRGLGWAATFPTISQRVANETALVVDEIELRYPAQR